MRSIWERTSFQSTSELAIVGAGITGLCTALHYKREHPRHRVLVLERGPHPIGASVKNAGFACFGSPSELLHDLDNEGAEAMLQRVEQRWLGLQELRKEFGDAAIGFDPVGGYEVFRGDDALYSRVAEGFDGLNTRLHGIFGKDVFTWVDERAAAMGLGAAHLSFTPWEGAVDSGRMMRSLLEKVQSLGVEVQFNSTVESREERGSDVELRLHDGRSIQAANVVLATNGFSRGLAPQSDILPARGQVVLTTEIPGLLLKGTFHIDEGYYYFRHYGGRVLLGGGRHLDKAGETTEEDGTSPVIQAALEEMLRTVILPGQEFAIEQRWSGVMGFREHGGPPVVERISPRVVLAAGLGGIGVAIGIRVAREAAVLVG